MNKKILLMILVAASAALSGCGEHPAEQKADAVRVEGEIATIQEEGNAAFLKVVAVEPDKGRELRLPGRLVWNETRTVRVVPQVGGRIASIAADLGDRVKAGQALAVLMSPDYGQAQSEAHQAVADLRVAEQAHERSRALREAGIIADKDWQAAEADLVRAKAEAQRTHRRLSGLGGDGDGSYTLRSPLAGIVVERNLNPGLEYRPDQAGAPLFVVTDPTSLWLQLDASEEDVRHLKPGESVALEVKGLSGESFKGTIRQVADFVDPQTRTIHVRGEVANADRRLKGEMFVQARVELPPGDVLHVPASAVFLQGDKRYVFVEEKPGRYRRQRVEAADERDGWLDVSSGLKAGDRVVVEGNLNLLKYFRPQAGAAAK
jgi:cobalt-zinc-cadmium efflux system membrane fusion protein